MGWYERLYEMYKNEKINDKGLANAVTRGWITQAEADIIKAAKTA